MHLKKENIVGCYYERDSFSLKCLSSIHKYSLANYVFKFLLDDF